MLNTADVGTTIGMCQSSVRLMVCLPTRKIAIDASVFETSLALHRIV